MMTQTQKNTFEWPILLTILWIVQSFEISILHLPFGLGSIHVIPVLIVYVALTRRWGQIAVLAFVFAFIGSPTIGYPATIYIGVQIWTALVTRGIVSGLALEGRRPFTVLVAGSHLFSKFLTWFVLKTVAKALPWTDTLFHGSLTCITAAALGWFLFPLFVGWDEFFEHEADEARELNPNVLR